MDRGDKSDMDWEVEVFSTLEYALAAEGVADEKYVDAVVLEFTEEGYLLATFCRRCITFFRISGVICVALLPLTGAAAGGSPFEAGGEGRTAGGCWCSGRVGGPRCCVGPGGLVSLLEYPRF